MKHHRVLEPASTALRDMSILDDILANTEREVADRQSRLPLDEIQRRVERAPAVRTETFASDMSLIAEVKRRSPSKGDFGTALNPVTQARAYERGGASVISVLTDARYFNGSFKDLQDVHSAVTLPVLCKDFFITPYQVFEARALGADLVLLVVAALDDTALIELHRLALELGMLPLVEVHDQHELARAIAIGAHVIGINNRDLTDFSVDLLTTEYLAPLVPDEAVVVSESGISTREDVERVAAAGARVVLVGETLIRSADPAAKIQELLG